MTAPVAGNKIWQGTIYVIIAALLFALAPAVARSVGCSSAHIRAPGFRQEMSSGKLRVVVRR